MVVQNSFQRHGGRGRMKKGKPKELKVCISRIVLSSQDRKSLRTQLQPNMADNYDLHLSIMQKSVEVRPTRCEKQQAHKTHICLFLQPPQPLPFAQTPRRPLLPSLVACSRLKTPTDLRHCLFCLDTTMHLHSHKCLLPAQLSCKTGSFSTSAERGH